MFAKDVRLFGEPVLWFNNGDRSAEPTLGWAIRKAGSIITMLTIRENGMNVSTKRGVRHIDDPELQAHPQAKAHAGAWMTVEQFEKEQADAKAQRELDSENKRLSQERKQKEIERRVAEEAKKSKKEPVSA